MNMRPIGVLTALGALLLPLLASAPAAAQPFEPDGPRFRGGVSLEGGALVVPGIVSIGAIGVQGQLGGQISNNWAVYGIPTLDVLFGKLGGLGVSAGVLAEYTFTGLPISVGAGPEAGLFVVVGAAGASGSGTVSDAGGAFYGARLHFGYHPVIYHAGIRRKALTIGVDLRMLTGAFGAESISQTTVTETAKVNSFAVSPVVSIGYTAF
jgi:hypothetical protein